MLNFYAVIPSKIALSSHHFGKRPIVLTRLLEALHLLLCSPIPTPLHPTMLSSSHQILFGTMLSNRGVYGAFPLATTAAHVLLCDIQTLPIGKRDGSFKRSQWLEECVKYILPEHMPP